MEQEKIAEQILKRARREAAENESVAPQQNYLHVGETAQAISVRQQKKAKREGGLLASEKQKEKRKEQKIKAKRKLHESKRPNAPHGNVNAFASEIGFNSTGNSHRDVGQRSGPAQVGAEREKRKKNHKGATNGFKFREKNGGMKLRKGGKPTGFKSAKRFKRR